LSRKTVKDVDRGMGAPPSGQGLARPRRNARLSGSLALAALIAIAVGLAAVLTSGSSGTGTLSGPAGNAFALTYPSSWQPLTSVALAKYPAQTLAGLVRKDGKGVVTIRRDRSADGVDGKRLAQQLNAGLKRRLHDYKLVAAQIMQTQAGRVLFYTYLRTKKGTLNTIAIIPAGDHSYVMDTVSNPGAADVAVEIVAMIRSFQPA
jgi:hypothetical protein